MDTETDTLSPARARQCAYTNEAMIDEGSQVVAIVVENEGGWTPTTYHGDSDYCERVAAHINETLGLTRDDVLNIVASSMSRG